MRLWSPQVRASVLEFELASALRVTVAGDATEAARLWHFELSATAPAATPSAAAAPLIEMRRPPEASFVAQLEYLNSYAQLRPDRAAEIDAQLTTPVAFLGAIVYLHPARTARTLELLALAQRLANLVEMRLKHALTCRRPIEYSPQVQPMLQTPAHGPLPSGHAPYAFTIANVLDRN